MITYNGQISVLERLAQIATLLNPVAIVTPVNVKEAKKAWLDHAKNGVITNPYFEYNTELLTQVVGLRDEFAVLVNDLRQGISYQEGTDKYIIQFMDMLIEERIAETNHVISLASGILEQDHVLAAIHASELYGTPLPDTTTAAYAAAKTYRLKNEEIDDSQNTIGAGSIQLRFERLIEHLGVTGWNVSVDSAATAIDVRDQTSTVYIPDQRYVSEHKLRKLLGHEINSHLRGSANCRALLKMLFGEGNPLGIITNWLAKSSDETIYEGVAKTSDIAIESETGVSLEDNPEVSVPWYVIAADYALRGHNFVDTAEHVIEGLQLAGVPENKAFSKAWVYTYRIFRGSVDTADSGYVFLKDCGYFEGYNLVKNADDEMRAIYKAYSSFSAEFLESNSFLLAQYRAAYKPLSPADF